MKYTGRTSRNINIKALGLLLCILVASYGIIKAPASDTRKLEADLRKKQQLINEEKGKKVDGTSTLPSQSTSALHTTVPANNMPADTGKDITIKKHFVTVIGDSVFLGASVAFQQQCENAVVDAKISRQVVQALDVAKQLDKKHKLGDITVGRTKQYSTYIILFEVHYDCFDTVVKFQQFIRFSVPKSVDTHHAVTHL